MSKRKPLSQKRLEKMLERLTRRQAVLLQKAKDRTDADNVELNAVSLSMDTINNALACYGTTRGDRDANFDAAAFASIVRDLKALTDGLGQDSGAFLHSTVRGYREVSAGNLQLTTLRIGHIGSMLSFFNTVMVA